jgi:hypothetical protein
MGKYVVIEDLNSFDCYSVLSKKDYKKNYSDKKVLYSGSVEDSNQWIIDNPHPNVNDFVMFFNSELENDNDAEDTGLFI